MNNSFTRGRATRDALNKSVKATTNVALMATAVALVPVALATGCVVYTTKTIAGFARGFIKGEQS